ncbi:MAG: YicC family protein [Firmicutes bacterium]|nr:YicC family protein [Bacillota bacterium]
MARSMTGFGRSEVNRDGWSVSADVKSVNHRYLDISIRLPKGYQILEETIRPLVQERFARGRIEIYLKIEELGEKDRIVKIDKGLLQGVINEWKALQAELPLPDLTFDNIFQIPDLIQIPEHGVDWESLASVVSEVINQCLDNISLMRQKEGEELTTDILHKLGNVEHLIQEITVLEPLVVENYRARLKERLQELLQGTTLTEERFEAEVAIFADRASIDEEIVRLLSHVQQFNQSILEDVPVGRKLDFIIQEMNREVNTIGSKANDYNIARLVVELKSELERLREQVQNLE